MTEILLWYFQGRIFTNTISLEPRLAQENQGIQMSSGHTEGRSLQDVSHAFLLASPESRKNSDCFYYSAPFKDSQEKTNSIHSIEE